MMLSALEKPSLDLLDEQSLRKINIVLFLCKELFCPINSIYFLSEIIIKNSSLAGNEFDHRFKPHVSTKFKKDIDLTLFISLSSSYYLVSDLF